MTAISELNAVWVEAAKAALEGDMRLLRLRVQLSEMNIVAEDRFLTANEVCAKFGICLMTLYRWERTNGLSFPKPYKDGRKKVYRESDLDAWTDNRRVSAREIRGEVSAA